MNCLNKSLSNKRITGQGMTEYIIIVALIAIAAITVYTFFGKTMRTQVGGMAQELSGTTSTAATAAQGAASTAVGDAAKTKGMGKFENADANK